MKRSILALSCIVTAFFSVPTVSAAEANRSQCNIDGVLIDPGYLMDPRNCESYRQLAEYNPEFAQALADAFINEGKSGQKQQALIKKIQDGFKNEEVTKAEKFAALVVLDNLNISHDPKNPDGAKYDSILEQLAVNAGLKDKYDAAKELAQQRFGNPDLSLDDVKDGMKTWVEDHNGDVGIDPPSMGIPEFPVIPTPIHGGDDAIRDRIAEELKTNPDFAKEILPKAVTIKVKANVERIKHLDTNIEKVDELNSILDGKATLEIIDAPVDSESGNGAVLKVTTRSGEEVTFNEEQAEARVAEAKGKAEERQNTREPQPIEMPEIGADPEQVKEAVQNLTEAGTSSATTMAELYSTTADNSLKIEDLYNQIDRLDEKMDGVMASTQAVNAARPYLFNGQTSAVGVGIGAAGSEQAVAVGYAHRINENWSANANVSATSGNDTEVSAGAGVSFAW